MPHHSGAVLRVFVLSFRTLRFLSILSYSFLSIKSGMGAKLSTLGYYLQRWGFSVQRPVKRAYKQDQEKIDKWLNEEFPGITERANAENAEI